jgi:hypothetical protein
MLILRAERAAGYGFDSLGETRLRPPGCLA